MSKKKRKGKPSDRERFSAFMASLRDEELVAWDGFLEAGLSESQAQAMLRPRVVFGGKTWRRGKQAVDVYHDVDSANLVQSLDPLRVMTNLRELSVVRSEINNLEPLEDLTKLVRLCLCEAPFSDIRPIAKLSKLTSLELIGTNLQDLRPLSKLQELQWLELRDNPISDLRPLSGLNELEALGLSETQVVDLSPLATCTSLVALHVDASVPTEQVRALKDALPGLTLEPLREWWDN